MESLQDRPIAPPHKALLAFEVRAFLELPALIASAPFLRRAPRGDGHSVIVVPGFGTTDASTGPLRLFLRALGYDVHGWKNGRNTGPTHANFDAIIDAALEKAERTGAPVSLIGWSLGGCLVREVARDYSDFVRQVITLGSPFRDVAANNIKPLWKLFSSKEQVRSPVRMRLMPEALPVPATAIWSRTDGVVAGEACKEPAGPNRESVEVLASHGGLGLHAPAFWAIADRLAQPLGEWKRFKPGRALELFYPTLH